MTLDQFGRETIGLTRRRAIADPDQLDRMLGPAGFDAARYITAITVNRWPHGYAYEYNPLFDPEWAKGEAPHEVGRARFGPIAIANSDAAAAAYTDAAIDQAQRGTFDPNKLSQTPRRAARPTVWINEVRDRR